MTESNKRRTSRRQFLGSAAAVGLGGGLLAACGDDEEAAPAATTTTAAAATTTAAAATTTAAAATTTAASATSDIPPAKVGFVTPRTGPLAALGETDDFVLAQMRELFGDRIEIIDKDTETDATRAGEVTNELIAEGVDLVLCGGTPDTTIPVAAASIWARPRACRRWLPGSRTTSTSRAAPLVPSPHLCGTTISSGASST